jgi:hypothetical protein
VVWTGLIWLRLDISGDWCEHRNEPFGSIKRLGNFSIASQLSVCQEELSFIKLVTLRLRRDVDH